jgi:hypothetical protein
MADKEIVESLNKISGNLDAINKTIEAKHEEKSTTSAEDWKKRIEPLIEEVNRACKKKRFTTSRKKQISIIILTSLIIGFLVAVLNYSAYNMILGFAKVIPFLTPSNQTQVIGNQTVPESQINQINFMMNQFPALMSVTIGVIAIIVTLYSIMVPLIFGTSKQRELAEEYYQKLLDNKPENDRPYLKALINMKCREFDLNLSHIYHAHPELFEEKLLLQRLYE